MVLIKTDVNMKKKRLANDCGEKKQNSTILKKEGK